MHIFNQTFSPVSNLKLNFACMCREVNEEFLEFECHMKFDFDVLRGHGIPYKYCVFGTDHADMFEYLHGAPPQGWRNSIRNRCLRVNNKPGKGIYDFVSRDQCHIKHKNNSII